MNNLTKYAYFYGDVSLIFQEFDRLDVQEKALDNTAALCYNNAEKEAYEFNTKV